MKTLVLGLGNELSGDEGPSIQAVRKLRQEFGLKSLPRSRLQLLGPEICIILEKD